MVVSYEPSLLPTFLAISRQFHLESRFKDVPYAQDKVTKLLSNPNAFCALYKVGDNHVGGMLGLVQEHWFTHAKVGFDLGLYILPSYRGRTSAPVRLVRAFEAFCESKGCFEISLSSSAQIHEQRALRLYESMGYKRSGFMSHKSCQPHLQEN
jgi:ribosomal protein S18 acetylase RimI-like enzyme